MNNGYDQYYQTEKLFGKPYRELIEYFSRFTKRGKLLDLGCGQGRDAIPLARMGFNVTGIDSSKVGIQQLNRIAKREDLPLIGIAADIYSYSDFDKFEFILLDSMFHFGKKETAKEISFINDLFMKACLNTYITICIQKTGKKVEILYDVIGKNSNVEIVNQLELEYTYNDQESDHSSTSKYQMITVLIVD